VLGTGVGEGAERGDRLIYAPCLLISQASERLMLGEKAKAEVFRR